MFAHKARAAPVMAASQRFLVGSSHVSISSPTAPTGAQDSSAHSLRQPAGLKVIFFTEMWERFSYYGMRALLVLYLVNSLGYSRDNALALYGLYTGLVYFTPMIGGALADRYLGKRRAAVIGGTVMMLGHIAMTYEPLLHLALGLLIVGNGLFKPNTTSMVGDLYQGENDPRRAGGYSIFYMGVNLGAFLAPLVAGTLGEKVGWHYGFGAAAVGMAAGLTQFLMGQKSLGRAGLKPEQGPITKTDLVPLLTWVGGCVALVVGILLSWKVIGPIYDGLPVLAKIAAALAARLGFTRVLWLGDGLINDHTDGHVDNLARFVAPNRLVVPQATGKDDPNAAIYEDAAARAAAAGVEVARIPSPGRMERDGIVEPASYVNFAITSNLVVVPTFGSPHDADGVAAIAALQRDPARYLGFVEVHVEQGPVLHARTLPLVQMPNRNGFVADQRPESFVPVAKTLHSN